MKLNKSNDIWFVRLYLQRLLFFCCADEDRGEGAGEMIKMYIYSYDMDVSVLQKPYRIRAKSKQRIFFALSP